MSDTPPRCPDCGVETEEMRLDASGYNLRFVSEKNREGIMGRLGVKQTFDADAFVCPECRLARLYAGLEE